MMLRSELADMSKGTTSARKKSSQFNDPFSNVAFEPAALKNDIEAIDPQNLEENLQDNLIVDGHPAGYSTLQNESEDTLISIPFAKKRSLVDYLRQNRNHLKAITAFIIANFLYIISDRKCPFSSVDNCATKFILANAPKWSVQIFISAIIFVVLIRQRLSRKISRFYSLAAIINIIYLCFYYHPVLSGQEYGQLFAFFLGLFVFLILMVISITSLIRGCYRKSPYGTSIGIPAMLLMCLIIFYFTRFQDNCANWSKGLGNERIQEDDRTCTIKEPSICAFEVTDGFFDFSRFMTCSSYEAKQSIMDEYYPKTPYVGFARTEYFTENERFTLQSSIYNHTVPLNSLNDPAAAGLEIFLDKTSETHPSILIDVKRNETLVEERAKIEHQSLAKNVLVIYIDALSRAASLRKLKKTMSWFDSHTQQKDPNLETFQYFKYHSITPYTTNNLYEALFGTLPNGTNTHENRTESFLKKFKDNGFITGHASDYCQVSPLDMFPGQPIKEEPYDHEGLSFACDPHFHNPKSAYSIFNGPYSSVRRCLYGKDLFENVFDYGTQFWNSYKDEKKLLYLDFLDAHEGTGEVIKYMDDAIYDFLNNLKTNNLLEDTAIVFYSDHGLHMQGILYLLGLDAIPIEIALPTLYLTLPKDVAAKYKKDIKENEQKLVFSHDVHDFFITLAEGEKSTSLKTSIIGPLPFSRTCNDIFVKEQPCACTYDWK